ncbi:hypothetical protein [Actinocorallia longicatena]|uniref:Sensor domain-containing protein n=1 Tax=Actinocorallia longicatena TaxID=111803 RepID=A0ABP6QAR5_9ACTN
MTDGTSFIWRDRWASAPLWSVFLVCALPYGAVMGLYSALSDGESLLPVLSIGVVSGLVFGLALTYWVARARRRTGLAELEPGSRRSLTRALRTGRLPDDVSLYPALERMIACQRRQLHRSRFTHPAIYGVLALISAAVAIDEPAYWLIVALFLAFLAYGPFAIRRATNRLDAVERAMHS